MYLFIFNRLYDKVNTQDQAASAYTEYVKENACLHSADNKSELSHAYKYLATYHLKNSDLELAYQFAQKCLSFEEVSKTLFVNIVHIYDFNNNKCCKKFLINNSN